MSVFPFQAVLRVGNHDRSEGWNLTAASEREREGERVRWKEGERDGGRERDGGGGNYRRFNRQVISRMAPDIMHE